MSDKSELQDDKKEFTVEEQALIDLVVKILAAKIVKLPEDNQKHVKCSKSGAS